MIGKLELPPILPLSPFIEHHFYQVVHVITCHIVESKSDEISSYFVSCPETGLTNELINIFLAQSKLVPESVVMTNGSLGVYPIDERGVHITYRIPEPNIVYGKDDEALLMHRRFTPEKFCYSVKMDEHDIAVHLDGVFMMSCLSPFSPESIVFFLDTGCSNKSSGIESAWRLGIEAIERRIGGGEDADDYRLLCIDGVVSLLTDYYRKECDKKSSAVVTPPFVS